MKNSFKVGFAGLAMVFASAATPVFAGEGAPVISEERFKSIRLCEDKLEAIIEQHDTRAPGTSIERYYHMNEANKSSIKTAIQTGKFESDLERLGVLGQLQTMLAIGLVYDRGFHCATLADENGNLDDTRGGLKLLDRYVDYTNMLVETSNEMYEIVKKLKEEGDKLIAAGTKAASPDAPVYLFR